MITEKAFEKKKKKEWYKKNKYIYTDITQMLLTLGPLTPMVIMLLENSKEAVLTWGTLSIVGLPMTMVMLLFISKTENKREKELEEHQKQEKIKEIKKTFTLFKEEEMNSVNATLKNIVFSEKKPRKEEIEKINEIITVLNQLYEDGYQERTSKLQEELDRFVDNLKSRKYAEKENVEESKEFNEKQSVKLERMLEKTEITEIKEYTNGKTILEMKVECIKIKEELEKMKKENLLVKELHQYLEKIEFESEKINEENTKKIKAIYEKVINESKKEIKDIKEEAEKRITEKLNMI